MHLDRYTPSVSAPSIFQTKAWRQAWLLAWQQQSQAGESYSVPIKIKGLYRAHSNFPLGCQSPGLRSIRSEYFTPDTESFSDYLNAVLVDTSHQLTFPDVIVGSPFYQALQQLAIRQKRIRVVEKNPDLAYSVQTGTGTFNNYLAHLGSNTRLKLYNRRKRLASLGTVALTKSKDDDTFLDQLNAFHQVRWGKPCYQGNNLVFIRSLLPALRAEGHSVCLSELRVDQKVISVLLDIQVGQRIYNLQSGFIEDFSKGVSTGLLHLGYQLESAFNDSSVSAYDFMAGHGKNANYKARIATQKLPLTDVVLVKSQILKAMYQLQHWLQRR